VTLALGDHIIYEKREWRIAMLNEHSVYLAPPSPPNAGWMVAVARWYFEKVYLPIL
jgi:hypothetical protein